MPEVPEAGEAAVAHQVWALHELLYVQRRQVGYACHHLLEGCGLLLQGRANIWIQQNLPLRLSRLAHRDNNRLRTTLPADHPKTSAVTVSERRSRDIPARTSTQRLGTPTAAREVVDRDQRRPTVRVQGRKGYSLRKPTTTETVVGIATSPLWVPLGALVSVGEGMSGAPPKRWIGCP